MAPTPFFALLTRLSSRLRGCALARDRRGAALLEFALVAIPFFALMIAIIQTSLTFFAQQTLETTTEKAVRPLITGDAQKTSMTKAQFKTSVCAKLPVFMKCAKTIIDVQSGNSFSGATTTVPTITYDGSGNPQDGAWVPGGQGQITVVKILYIWDTQTGPLGFDLSTMSGNKRLLVATSVFKTEPYVT